MNFKALKDFFINQKNIRNNAVFLLLGQVTNRGLLLIFFILLARFKGDTFLGEYSLLITYASLMLPIVTFGLERIVLREVSNDPEKILDSISSSFKGQFGIWLLVFPLALVFSFIYFGVTLNTVFLFLLGFWVLISSLNLTIKSSFHGDEQMGITALFEILSAAQLLIISLIIVLFDGGILGIVYAMLFERSTIFILNIILFKKLYGSIPRLKGPYAETFAQLKIAIPFVTLNLLGMAHQRIDILLMPTFVDLADIGQYASAYKILEATLIIPAVIASAAFPQMSRQLNKESFEDYRIIAGNSIGFSLTIGFVVIGFTIIFSELIISWTFGGQFQQTAQVLRILILGLFFQSLNNTLGRCIIAGHKEKYFIPIVIFALTTNIVSNLILLPRYGIQGAAYSTLISYFVSTSAHIGILAFNNISPSYKKLSQTFQASIIPIMSAIILIRLDFPPLVTWILSLSIFGFSIFMIGIYSLTEIKNFYMPKNV